MHEDEKIQNDPIYDKLNEMSHDIDVLKERIKDSASLSNSSFNSMTNNLIRIEDRIRKEIRSIKSQFIFSLITFVIMSTILFYYFGK